MYEISSRFRGDDSFEPVFVMWDKGTASFYEVDFDQIETFLKESQTSLSESAWAHRRAQYVALFKRVYHHVPLSRTMYNTYSSLRSKAIRLRPSSGAITLEPNTMLFMPHGGVWESQTYIAKILELSKTSGLKLVPILFDMCPVISPQFVVEPVQEAFENYMKQVLPKSDLVLAISENTARDAKKWLASVGLDNPTNIKVFRLGDEIGGGKPKPVNVPSEFVVCVGTVEARKNHTGLYYAYKLAAERGESLPPVVIAGRKGWMSGDVYQLMTNDPDIRDKFTFLHNATDDELAWLYQNALFSVYPSFYEGWGLPIAESLLRGTPCVASGTSSMKEIGGDLVSYFSPFSSNEIKDKISAYSNDRNLLKSMRKRISKEYKTTTWDMSYAEVAKEIKKLL